MKYSTPGMLYIYINVFVSMNLLFILHIPKVLIQNQKFFMNIELRFKRSVFKEIFFMNIPRRNKNKEMKVCVFDIMNIGFTRTEVAKTKSKEFNSTMRA